MRTSNEYMKNNILALAVQGALIAMFTLPMIAQAEEAAVDEATALTHPTNSVELGGTSVSRNSAKFGEYNGLDENGAYGIANINLRGGNGYDQGDNNIRWQLKGVDLGTTSREVGAELSSQGKWDIGVKFDELRHNLSDSYQTPYQGSMGGNSFTLPTGFGTASDTTAMSAGQKAALHNVDIHTTRENSSISAGYTISPQLDVKFDFNHLNQTGAKLMAFGAAGVSIGGTTPGGEVISILPNPTNYTTDTVNLALNWTGDKGHLTGSYYGSFFRDEFSRVTFTTYNTANVNQTMGTAPDNNFNQFNLLGGYEIADKTKLAGSLSYGRATQNDAFVYDTNMMVGGLAPPRTSADAKVINTHADFKLTNQSLNKLTLTAGVKYDERDNKTPSSIYNFQAISGSANNRANYPNIALSNRKTQFELAGDYRITSDQHIRLAYNRENIQRWCNEHAIGGGKYFASNGSTVTADAPYAADTGCVVADRSHEDKLSANYKLNATENLKLNAGYSYGNRNTNFNILARTAFIEVGGGGLTNTTTPGINGGDFQGFHPFFEADRIQQAVKGGLDWQANENLTLNLNGRYTDDNYNTAYGFQKGNTWSSSLDANYSFSDSASINAYVTKEHRSRDMTNLQTLAAITATTTKIAVPAGGTWTNTLQDDDITVGLGAKQAGLLGGKLGLAGDLTYSFGETSYGTVLNYDTTDSNVALRNCSNSNYLTCGQLPDVQNRLIQLKLVGDYKVNKQGKVALGYIYQHFTNTDYYYNALQTGVTPTKLMPTNQDGGSYSINVVTATYTYTF